MKKIVFTYAFLGLLTISLTNCREEKTADEKVEEALNEITEDLENASDDVKDAAEDLQDEIDEVKEEVGDDN